MNKMNIDEKTAFTAAGFVITWLVGIFGAGFKFGKHETRLDAAEKAVAGLAKKFTTGDGEERLLSIPAHNAICSDRQRVINSTLQNHDAKLDKILDSIADIREDVAALKK